MEGAIADVVGVHGARGLVPHHTHKHTQSSLISLIGAALTLIPLARPLATRWHSLADWPSILL
jgi:hypothetical protein